MSEKKTEHHQKPQNTLETLGEGSGFSIVLSGEDIRRVWPNSNVSDQDTRKYRGVITLEDGLNKVVLKTDNEEYDRRFRIIFDIRDNALYYGDQPIGTVKFD